MICQQVFAVNTQTGFIFKWQSMTPSMTHPSASDPILVFGTL